MSKNFLIPASQIKQLIEAKAGCIATDRITVDGVKVGWMYRENPSRLEDSGWRIFPGDENDDYMADASKHSPYATNTIANYDPSIIPYLDSPIGSAFERLPETQDFVKVDDEDKS